MTPYGELPLHTTPPRTICFLELPEYRHMHALEVLAKTLPDRRKQHPQVLIVPGRHHPLKHYIVKVTKHRFLLPMPTPLVRYLGPEHIFKEHIERKQNQQQVQSSNRNRARDVQKELHFNPSKHRDTERIPSRRCDRSERRRSLEAIELRPPNW